MSVKAWILSDTLVLLLVNTHTHIEYSQRMLQLCFRSKAEKR